MLNQAQKIIWSGYLLIWLYIFFLVEEYSRDSYIFGYLILGWIPFLIAHFIWKNKSNKTASKWSKAKSDKVKKSVLMIGGGILLWLLSKVIGGVVFELGGLIVVVFGIIDLIKGLKMQNNF